MAGKYFSLLIAMALAFSTYQNNAFSAEQAGCAGCKTEYFLIKEIADTLNANQSAIQYKPAKTGNKKAVELMIAQKVDFAFTCKDHWKLAKKFKLDKEKTASWKTIQIAHDPIVVIVNPDSGCKNITMNQLCGIFDGSITNWKEISGKELEIQIGYLDESVESGIVTVFKETSIGANNNLTAKATKLKAPSNLGNFCKATSGAVVFMGLNSFQEQYGTVLSIDNIKPDSDNVKSNKYPLAATYHIIYDSKNAKAAQIMLDYIANDNGQKIINKLMIASEIKEISN